MKEQVLRNKISSVFFFKWFTLNDVKHGRVHLILEWLPTVTQPERLQKVQNNINFFIIM